MQGDLILTFDAEKVVALAAVFFSSLCESREFQKQPRLCAVSSRLDDGPLFFTLDSYFNGFLVKNCLTLKTNKSSCS